MCQAIASRQASEPTILVFAAAVGSGNRHKNILCNANNYNLDATPSMPVGFWLVMLDAPNIRRSLVAAGMVSSCVSILGVVILPFRAG